MFTFSKFDYFLLDGKRAFKLKGNFMYLLASAILFVIVLIISIHLLGFSKQHQWQGSQRSVDSGKPQGAMGASYCNHFGHFM
jgi:hypothetical protein